LPSARRFRIVEEDELRVADEREAEVEPTLLAARERPGPRVPPLGEPDDRHHLLRLPRPRVVAREHLQALEYGQVRVERRRLQHHADPLPPGRPCGLRVDAEHLDAAGVATAVALEDLDRRRLAGAVRPEQAEHLARIDGEVDAPKGLPLPVALAQAANDDRVQSSSSATPAGGNGTSRPVSARAISPQSG
jgi:hypothetical protein